MYVYIYVCVFSRTRFLSTCALESAVSLHSHPYSFYCARAIERKRTREKAHTYICTYIYIYICIYICICIHICIYIYICIYLFLYVYDREKAST